MSVPDRLIEIFRDVLEDEDLVLSDETTAADIEEWDSLAHVTLMFHIEQEFGIQFAGSEFARLEDIGELRRLVESKLEERHSA